MILAMADFSWVNLTEPHERLRWARMQRYETAEAAAQALGMQPNTYRNHEREPGSSRSAALTAEKAMRFGKAFRVRWEWLFQGSGEPTQAPDQDEEARRIASAYAGLSPEDRVRVSTFMDALKRTG